MGDVFVKNGTPVGNDILCRTCSWAHITTGYRDSEMLIICTDVSPNLLVPFRVRECTGYHSRTRPSWDQMEKLAIHVNASPTLKPVGFRATGPDTDPDTTQDDTAGDS